MATLICDENFSVAQSHLKIVRQSQDHLANLVFALRRMCFLGILRQSTKSNLHSQVALKSYIWTVPVLKQGAL